MEFYTAWFVSALGVVLLAVWAGRKVRVAALGNRSTILGILIDDRERFSLNRFQLIVWTILILSTFLGLLVSNLVGSPTTALAIPAELLGLLGISAGSAAVAGAVKDGKNVTRPETIAGGEGFVERTRARAKNAFARATVAAAGVAAAAGRSLDTQAVLRTAEAVRHAPSEEAVYAANEAVLASAAIATAPVAASAAVRLANQAAVLVAAVEAEPQPLHFAQVFLEEEGSGGMKKVVSATKFQNFVFTIALAAVYVALAIRARGYPAFDDSVLWLIGISHAGYIGGKIPNKE